MDADERAEHMRDRLSKRDLEVLERFYVDGQDPSQICSEMDLTIERFHLVKWLSRMLFLRAGEELESLTWVALPFRPN
jgi:hypothetical protein